jgi:HAD superfamily hydrolase (TIGR01484 family)
MKITNLNKLKSKKLIVFDLDGTLAPTKSAMEKDMSKLLEKLLKRKKVAVIGGGKYEIFQMQLLDELKISKSLLKNLFLFPTTATAFYRFQNGWKAVYALTLSKPQAQKIKNAFERVFKETGHKHPKKIYGELIENRGSQVSFSFLGQDVVKF